MKKILFFVLIYCFPLLVLAESCPPDKPLAVTITYRRDRSGHRRAPSKFCSSCDEIKILPTTEYDCKLCPNREYVPTTSIFNSFYGCVLKECPQGTFKNGEPSCIECANSSATNISSQSECTKCSNRIFVNRHCVLKDRPLWGSGSFTSVGSFPCDSLEAIRMYSDTCALCPNRILDGEYCILEKCPAGTHRENGSCLMDCLSSNSFNTSAVECVSQCPDREYVDGKCILKSGKDSPEAKNKAISCDIDEFLSTEGGGICKPCSANYLVASSEEECNKCKDENGNPTRKIFTTDYGNHMYSACGLIDCGKNFFHTSTGYCHPCSIDGLVDTSPEECNKCKDENGRPIRKVMTINNIDPVVGCGLIK